MMRSVRAERALLNMPRTLSDSMILARMEKADGARARVRTIKARPTVLRLRVGDSILPFSAFTFVARDQAGAVVVGFTQRSFMERSAVATLRKAYLVALSPGEVVLTVGAGREPSAASVDTAGPSTPITIRVVAR